MTIEEKLRVIGFTGFIHLKKDERDGLERMFFTSTYENDWFSIMLIKNGDKWIVEEIEGNKEFKNIFNEDQILITDIINFFKTHYYYNSEISTLL